MNVNTNLRKECEYSRMVPLNLEKAHRGLQEHTGDSIILAMEKLDKNIKVQIFKYMYVPEDVDKCLVKFLKAARLPLVSFCLPCFSQFPVSLVTTS